jgi:hypothetical protein
VGAVITDVCILVAYRNHTLQFGNASTQQVTVESETTTASPFDGINLTSVPKSSQTRSGMAKTSDVSLEAQSMSRVSLLVIMNGVLYALLLSGVAINFPSGVIVAMIYFPLFLICLSR